MDTTTPERRELHFDTMDDLVLEAGRLDAAPRRASGSWTPAQNVQHIADAINRAIDGYDVMAPEAWQARARERRDGLLQGGFPMGIQLPENMQHYLPDANVTWDDALSNLRAAVARVETEHMTKSHPVLGDFTHEEWCTFHCRHAELHFSLIHPV